MRCRLGGRWRGIPGGGAAVGTLAALAVLAAAFGGGGDAPRLPEIQAEVEAVESRQDVDTNLVVAVGDVLLAPAVDRGVDPRRRALYRSEDGGRTWHPIGLPGAPDRLYHQGGLEPVLVGDLVVVTGHEMAEGDYGTDNDPYRIPAGDAYVWASADGREWQGGVLPGAWVVSTQTVVHAAGDVLIAGLPVGQPPLVARATAYALYRSGDDGASWTRAEVTADMTLGPDDRTRLVQVWEHDGRMYADLKLGRQVPSPDCDTVDPATTERSEPPEQAPDIPEVLESEDDGATWRLDPCPPPPPGGLVGWPVGA